jgi:transposase-like protein
MTEERLPLQELLAKAGEGAFLDRPLSGEWPYLWLDATYLRQPEGGRIVSVAAIVAVAANAEGRREVVGLHIGPSEAETFWSTFLQGCFHD